MKLGHFEALRPVCPVCRARGVEAPLSLAADAGTGDDIEAGVLVCREGCGQAFPIIEGTPILMPDLAGWLAANLHLLSQTEIVSAAAEAVIGAAAGADSAFNIVRQQQSTYGHAHYGDMDGPAMPGGVRQLLCDALSGGGHPDGPVLDLGCAVGGSTFQLCGYGSGPVLGIDINWPLLKVARRALERGVVRFPLRRSGIQYDRYERALSCADPSRADFWVADALALPFPQNLFSRIAGLNILDCVADPARLLRETARALRPEGEAVFATPFDWASHATPASLWIPGAEAAADLMTREGLTCREIRTARWHLRLHDHAEMTYEVKIFLGARAGNFL